MSDATIVALTILGGVFLLMALTILKSGIEAAIKMWSVMGALTGVAFGAITSYFFTKQVKDVQVAALAADKAHVEQLLASATQDAARAKSLVQPYYAALRGDPKFASAFPVGYDFAAKLPSEERMKLVADFSKTSSILESIQFLDRATNAKANSASGSLQIQRPENRERMAGGNGDNAALLGVR